MATFEPERARMARSITPPYCTSRHQEKWRASLPRESTVLSQTGCAVLGAGDERLLSEPVVIERTIALGARVGKSMPIAEDQRVASERVEAP